MCILVWGVVGLMLVDVGVVVVVVMVEIVDELFLEFGDEFSVC